MDTKVLIVDDMPHMLSHFEMIVQNESGYSVIGTATSGAEAVEKAAKLAPDLIMMDIQMEHDAAGIEATKKIKETAPETIIVMLTIHDDEKSILDSFSAGADDYIIKTAPISEILSILKDATGKISSRSHVNRTIMNEVTRLQNEHKSFLFMFNVLSKLSKSELEVLKLKYEGKSYLDIANIRFVEEVTVRAFANRILKKTGAENMKKLIEVLHENKALDFFFQQ